MSNFRNKIIFISLGLLAALEIFLLWPRLVYVSLFLILGLEALLAFWFLSAFSLKKRFISLALPPVILALALLAYLMLIPQNSFWNDSFSQALFFLLLWLNWDYWKNYEQALTDPSKPNSLETFLLAINFLSFFFLSSSIYGLELSLSLSSWILISLLLLLAALISYSILNRFIKEKKTLWLMVGVLVVILAQLAWPIYLLPFDYNVLGLFLSLAYYTILNLIKFYFSGTWNKKNLNYLLLFVASLLFIIFITAKWR